MHLLLSAFQWIQCMHADSPPRHPGCCWEVHQQHRRHCVKSMQTVMCPASATSAVATKFGLSVAQV